MPTFNRRSFVPQAVRYFLRQDYPAKELIVVDDGPEPVDDLLPDDPRIHYHRLETRTVLGTKRNLACDLARGPIIVHWDDDDWYAPWRIRTQLTAMLAAGTDLCGTDRPLFFAPQAQRAWRYVYPIEQPHWLAGSSLMYTADWQETRFEDVDIGEDTFFVRKAPRGQLTVLRTPEFLVEVVHARNVSPKHTSDSYCCHFYWIGSTPSSARTGGATRPTRTASERGTCAAAIRTNR